MVSIRLILRIFVVLFFVFLFSCKGNWTEKDKSEFTSGCMHGGAVSDMGEERAKAYCQCMLEKIIVKYPNSKDAKYLVYDTSLATLARECSKQR